MSKIFFFVLDFHKIFLPLERDDTIDRLFFNFRFTYGRAFTVPVVKLPDVPVILRSNGVSVTKAKFLSFHVLAFTARNEFVWPLEFFLYFSQHPVKLSQIISLTSSTKSFSKALTSGKEKLAASGFADLILI